MNELKCPFCGGKVVYYHTNHINLMRRTHAFRCEGCETLFYIPAKSKYVSEEDTEKEAVTTFNRSLTKTTKSEAIKEFAEMLKTKNEDFCVDKGDMAFYVDNLVKEFMEGKDEY